MKIALVLEGGASRTYFSAGVMDVMLEENIMTDMVIGSSAGIANGTSYVSRQIGRTKTIGTEYNSDKRYMGIKHLINPKNRSYYNLDFVFRAIPDEVLPFDYEAFKAYDGKVIATVTNIDTGKAEYMKVDGNDDNWTTIIASCALPLMFSPVEIEGQKYMDGGIADPIPLDYALEECDKAIVILTREKEYVKKKEQMIDAAVAAFRHYPKFTEALKNRTDVYNLSHAHALDMERAGKALVLAPSNTEGWKRTETAPGKIMEFYSEGRRVAFENMKKIKNFIAE